MSFAALRARVTCPQCQQLFREPKLLPCLHTVCVSCLQLLHKDATAQDVCGVQITCPVCQKVFSMPDGCKGVEDLQTSLVFSEMVRMVENVEQYHSSDVAALTCHSCADAPPAVAYCQMCAQFICERCAKLHRRWSDYKGHVVFALETLRSSDILKIEHLVKAPDCLQGVNYCFKHSSEKLKLYCEECLELICHDCMLKHRNHPCEFLSEQLVDTHCKNLYKALDTLGDHLQLLDEEGGNVMTKTEQLTKRLSETKEEIISVFCDVEKAAEKRKSELIAQLDELASQPMQALQDRHDEIESMRGQVTTSKDFLSDSIQHGGPLAALSIERTALNHVAGLDREVENIKCVSACADISLTCDKRSMEMSVSNFGQVHRMYFNPHTVSRTQLQSILPLPDSALTTKTTSDLTTISFSESQTESGFTQTATSPIALSSKVYGVSVRRMEGIFGPSGIAVTDKIIVCDTQNHKVVIFDIFGRNLSSFGGEGYENGQFLYPYKVVADHEGKMLVTDSYFRVQLFSASGQFLMSTGRKGSGQLEFRDPAGLAIGSKCNVFICERENHRVQVLNADFTFCRFIGKKGTSQCEFNGPTDIAADGRGCIYIADHWNHRIQVLTEDGSFVCEFGSKGSQPGQLRAPLYLCLDNDGFVYVTELDNNRVSVFQTNGQFVTCFGKLCLGSTRGIAIDVNRMLYVCDFQNDCIQVFK